MPQRSANATAFEWVRFCTATNLRPASASDCAISLAMPPHPMTAQRSCGASKRSSGKGLSATEAKAALAAAAAHEPVV